MIMIRKLMIGLIACVVSFAVNAADKTIVDVASGNKHFSTLVMLLKKADLVSTLQDTGPYTVFAPTNKAFAALPKKELDALLTNPEKLKAILLYHVVSGNMMSAQIKPGMVKTINGSDIDIVVKHGKVMVNNARVTKADLSASNGVIHVINKVLMPTTK
jgi:uncharacterized surface protein with fasciclin (FAS1) repeats